MTRSPSLEDGSRRLVLGRLPRSDRVSVRAISAMARALSCSTTRHLSFAPGLAGFASKPWADPPLVGRS